MCFSVKRTPCALRGKPAWSRMRFASATLNAASRALESWKRVVLATGLVAGLPTPNHSRLTMKLRSIAIDIARRTRASSSGFTRWFSSIHDRGEKYSHPAVFTSRFGRCRSAGMSKGSISLVWLISTWPDSSARRRLWLSGMMR